MQRNSLGQPPVLDSIYLPYATEIYVYYPYWYQMSKIFFVNVWRKSVFDIYLCS